MASSATRVPTLWLDRAARVVLARGPRHDTMGIKARMVGSPLRNEGMDLPIPGFVLSDVRMSIRARLALTTAEQ